ncbi:MAG: methyltransferase domain-containing protein [Thermoleophilaceae bacterium]|nr:methyltransferase domain-containing protein [Thermoleophilaceae bacterium]
MDLAAHAERIGWYHTMELAPGLTTPGMFDLRGYVDRYGLPERMDGMRALDVGAWDGFWSFEMERRGAQVVALDLDDERRLDVPPRRRPTRFPTQPRGAGFALAHDVFGSEVERVVCSIYDATPAQLGHFDIVFCGSVLIHLRDQLLALERIAALCRGTMISAEEYNRAAGLVPFPVSRYRADRKASVVFWQPSVTTWKRMILTAGFDTVEVKGRFTMRSPQGFGVRHVVLHGSNSVTAG